MSRINPAGLARLDAKFRQLPAEIQAALKARMQAAGQQVLAEAIRRVPVDTGMLRNSLTLIPKGEFGWEVSAFAVARRGKARLNYAFIVEFGTNRKITATVRTSNRGRSSIRVRREIGGSAQPFLHPAFARYARPILREIRKAIREQTRKIAAKG